MINKNFKELKDFIIFLPRALKQFIVIIIDIFSSALSVLLSFVLFSNDWESFGYNYWLSFCISTVLLLLLFFKFGIYRAIFRYLEVHSLLFSNFAFILYSIIFFFVFTIIGISNIPRAIGVIQPVLLFIFILISRYLVKFFLGNFSTANGDIYFRKSNTLIYGTGPEGRELAHSISNNNNVKLRGFIDDNPFFIGKTINNIPVYDINSLIDLVQKFDISDVLLAIPLENYKKRKYIIRTLLDCKVRVRTLPTFSSSFSGHFRETDICDLDLDDLLGRDIVPPNIDLLKRTIENKIVLVTGAGGSIGSELCRQIIRLSPSSLIMIDNCEYSLYLIYEELQNVISNSADSKYDEKINKQNINNSCIKLIPLLASVRDAKLMLNLFKTYRPDTVFHAAAYKHVPLVEINASEGILNNVYGTLACAIASLESGVTNFKLISTDKAVRPTNVMGASKRIAELILQSFAARRCEYDKKTIFSMVRFGNVLGSSGSVVPLFKTQIKAGGPLTITHPDVTRYFMSIPEAAQLVIQASAMSEGGDVFILDMGQPIRILDLALKMVHMSGLVLRNESNPHGDIEIKITGLRPGEKLYEELFIGNNPQSTHHPKIMKAHEDFLTWNQLEVELDNLLKAIDSNNLDLMYKILMKLLPGCVLQKI